MTLGKGSSEPTAEGSDPPRGPGPPVSFRTSHAGRTNIPPGWSGAATCPAGVGAGASPPLEDSPTHRIQCGWMRRALPPRHAGSLCQASLWTAYYEGTQCSRLRRTRAEPVCRINWIRRHDTFPSCRLRRKLHGPFSYVAGDAASYAWRCFDKTAPGHAERGIPGAGKEFQREIAFACNAIIYEQYAI